MTASRCEGGASVITVTQGEFSRDRRDTIDAEGRRWQVPMLVRTIDGKEQRVVVRDGNALIKNDKCGSVILNGGQRGYFRTLFTPQALDTMRGTRSEEQKSELQYLILSSDAVFCLKK